MKYENCMLRPATNADVPRLPLLLRESPQLVRVRNFWFSDESPSSFSLEYVVTGPYHVVEEGGHFVIHGFDRKTGLPGKARIDGTVFQFINIRYAEWGCSPSWLMLYVPSEA